MQKKCPDCSAEFTIEATELEFIEKISPVFSATKSSLPLPELCPDCRLQRRVIHRNEQFFYHNKSALDGKKLISIYSPDASFSKDHKIYSHEQWWSDSWDALDFGKAYDFKKPFFTQFQELFLTVPQINLMQMNNENCPYTTGTACSKNCHLINSSENCQDCYYGKLFQDCTDVVDSAYCYNSELLYECFNVTHCYNCFYLYYSQNSNDCFFSENLRGCKNCLFCTNLQNKEYHFLNQPLDKKTFKEKFNAILSSRENIEKAKEQLNKLRENSFHKYSNIINCENSSGDFLTNSKNCSDCYDVIDSEDCKYLTVGVKTKDILDCSNLYINPELCYQVLGAIESYQVIFSIYIFYSQNISYSQNCSYSKNLFGCVGLHHKEYCILNKQYSKEEYHQLTAKIAEQMKNTAEWGNFFPANASPFGYNQSVAQEYFPLDKKEALEKGFNWLDADKKDYRSSSYVPPSTIGEVDDSIVDEILSCKACSKNYKIIKQELKRLRDFNLPLPLNCPDCRQFHRMQLRNKRKLWDRSCDFCRTAIKSSYPAAKKEKIYCEKCFNDLLNNIN